MYIAPRSELGNWITSIQKIVPFMREVNKAEHKVGKLGVALINPLKFVHEKVTEDWAINHVHHEAYIHAMKYWPSWAKKNIRWIFPTAFRHRHAHGYAYDPSVKKPPVPASVADQLYVHDHVSNSWIPVGDVQGMASDGVPEAQQLVKDMESGVAPTATESVLLKTGIYEKATPAAEADALVQHQTTVPPPDAAAQRGAAIIDAKQKRNRLALLGVAGLAAAKLLALF